MCNCYIIIIRREEEKEMKNLDWALVYFGRTPRADIQKFIPEEAWQQKRIDMKGKSLEYKYLVLINWLKSNEYSYSSQIQVTNYVTALSRGGLIKPEDYRR